MHVEPPEQTFECDSLPSQAFRESIRQFNAGEYYVCHETLEELWLAEQGRLRRFYQGILQIGVGLHHLQRGNERGALLLLVRGTELLQPFAPRCLGIDVAALICGAEQVIAALRSLGLEATQAQGAGLFPQIRWVAPEGKSGSRGRATG